MADIHLLGIPMDLGAGRRGVDMGPSALRLARLAPNILSASGYSGHGVGTATLSGRLMAEAVRGQAEGFDCMARVPCPAFPGGTALRSPLLVLAMSWFALRDRLGL